MLIGLFFVYLALIILWMSAFLMLSFFAKVSGFSFIYERSQHKTLIKFCMFVFVAFSYIILLLLK